MQGLRERKQQYLRENILEKNYDAEEFMDFCESSHGVVDIDSWTLQELIDIVDKFVRSKTVVDEPDLFFNKTEIKIDTSISDQFNSWGNFIEAVPAKKDEPKLELNMLDFDFLESISGSPNSNKEKTSKQSYMSVPSDIAKKLQEDSNGFIAGYNPLILPQPQSDKIIRAEEISYPQQIRPAIKTNENFTAIIDCKKVVSKSKLIGNEEALISGHEVVNPNIFVPKFVLYYVTTNPLNVEVKRRMKDFESLRVLLQKFFPTTQIPHLERISKFSETEPQIIKKQSLFLQSFLNNLLMKKQLRCKLLEQFMLCPDLDLLKKIMKEYEKLSKPRSLEGLFTTSGTLNLRMCSQNSRYIQQQFSLNEFMKDHFTKMKTLYDQLIEGFEKNVKTISEIEALHSGFKDRIKTINSQFTPEYQCVNLEKSLQRVEFLHKQWSHSFKTQARIIQTQIRHLYRFESNNVQTLQELLKIDNEIESSYEKRGDKDQADRQKYESRRLEEFKMSIESPSKNITVLKYQTAYFQEKTCQECKTYLEEMSAKMDSKFKVFCTLQLSISQDMENVWRQFEKFYK